MSVKLIFKSWLCTVYDEDVCIELVLDNFITTVTEEQSVLLPALFLWIRKVGGEQSVLFLDPLLWIRKVGDILETGARNSQRGQKKPVSEVVNTAAVERTLDHVPGPRFLVLQSRAFYAWYSVRYTLLTLPSDWLVLSSFWLARSQCIVLVYTVPHGSLHILVWSRSSLLEESHLFCSWNKNNYIKLDTSLWHC